MVTDWAGRAYPLSAFIKPLDVLQSRSIEVSYTSLQAPSGTPARVTVWLAVSSLTATKTSFLPSGAR